MAHRSIVALILIPVLVLAGCGVDAETHVPVTGAVKFRNQRLTGGTIVFTPDRDRRAANELAVGQIKSDGTYQLKADSGTLIAPGWYRITIVAGYAPDSTLRLALPEKYRDPLRSGLEREVKAGNANVLDFDLQ